MDRPARVVARKESHMKDTGGGWAFPAQHFDLADGEHGMTLCDWYAGMALIGILARPAVNYRTADELARQAHALARAMLAERNKT
jgi:hypothetical protein